jgi:hypothetical protein
MNGAAVALCDHTCTRAIRIECVTTGLIRSGCSLAVNAYAVPCALLQAKWFAGTVTAAAADGTCSILYADGDRYSSNLCHYSCAQQITFDA